MLGDPESPVAELFGSARQLGGVVERLGLAATGDDWREVEHRQLDAIHVLLQRRRGRRCSAAQPIDTSLLGSSLGSCPST